MNKIQRLIREILTTAPKKKGCSCGCNTCDKAPTLNENLGVKRNMLSEHIQWHITNKTALTENTFRYGSDAFLDLWVEARKLYSRNLLNVTDDDKEIIVETNLGEYGLYENKKVPLDLPMLEEEILTEEEKKKQPALNKPHRGGAKKFYVYVRNPKTKKIKKVSFGDTTGLSAKINNPVARRAFAKRHNCPQKKDKTKASYWSCRLPRYAKLLGIKSTFSGYW